MLLITDEVMCGMGRCGAMFTSAQERIVPDIITVAKGLGAGYQPIGAMIARESVIAPIANGTGILAHGHTYMAHAVGCAAALAVLRVVTEEHLLDNVQSRGAELESQLRDAFTDHPFVGDIRGRGLFWRLELVQDRERKTPFKAAHRLATKTKLQARRLGLICYPSSGTADGLNGDHILLAPPFNIGSGHIDEMVAKLMMTLAEVFGEAGFWSEGAWAPEQY